MWDISPTPSFFLCFVVAMNDPSLCFRRQCLLVTHPTHPSKRFVGNSAQYCNLAEQIEQVQKKHDCLAGFYLSIFLDSANYCIIYIYNIMGHGQYLVYSSKSSIFEECIIVFQVLVYKQMLSFFAESIIVFQAPAQSKKDKDVSNTTLH